MKMKNCLSVLFSLMLLFGLGSCSSEEGKESVTGQGRIMVDLSTDLSYSRSVDESAYRIIRKSKFPQNPKRSVRFSGKRTKRSVQKRKARNTQKAETKVL